MIYRSLIGKKSPATLVYFISHRRQHQNYYKILEVPLDASDEDIKKNYYRLVKKYHPDLNNSHKSHIIKVNEAFDVLSNAQKRKEYD